jgi:predicted HTH domain antitoxin
MQLRLYAALQLFKKHKLSFGKAAELAGISRDEFLLELDKNDVDFIAYEASELERELARFQA